MTKVINCEDGVTVRGATDEELLANARAHIAEAHPDMVDTSDEELLGMAQEEPEPAQ